MRVGLCRQSPRRLFGAGVIAAVVASFGETVPTQSTSPQPYGISNLGALGGPTAAGQGISELGEIAVGRSEVAPGVFHAFAEGLWGRRDLGTLGGGFATAFAANGGSIVGQARTASRHDHAFFVDLARGSGMVDLGTLGGTWSAAYAIRFDTIVGASRTSGNARLRAFRHMAGTMSALPDWGGDSVAYGMNYAGEIVGYACTSGNVSCRAVRFEAGAAIDLGSLGGNSVATAINENGVVVGSSFTSGPTEHAFVYAGGVMRDIGTLGGQNSRAQAVNTAGTVVGFSQVASGSIRAFMWRDGVMTDLNTLLPPQSGWVVKSANGISEGGQIVGTGTFKGVTRAFLLTPPADLQLNAFGVRSMEGSNEPRGIEAGKDVRFVLSVQSMGPPAVTVYRSTITGTLTGPAEFIAATGADGDACDVTPKVVTCRLGPVNDAMIGREVQIRARTTGPGDISHRAVLTSDVPELNAADNVVVEENRAIALSALSLTPASVSGGRATSARVTLTDIAPSGDAIVSLSSSRPDLAPVPATIVVPSWTNTRAFNIVPASVAAPTPVEIRATYGGVTSVQTLTVVPVSLSQLYLTPTTVIGGCSASAGRVQLTGAAPAAGATVALTNTTPHATAPASVLVDPRATSKAFTVATEDVTSPVSGTVTASYGGVSQSLRLTVRPVRVQSVGLGSAPIMGGATITGTLTLECARSTPTVVTLLSDRPAVAAVPASVTIPAGATMASFPVRTSAVSATTAATIYATVFGVRESGTLTITP